MQELEIPPVGRKKRSQKREAGKGGNRPVMPEEYFEHSGQLQKEK
jgi:hypothetical protein